jgi:hypothetical protein
MFKREGGFPTRLPSYRVTGVGGPEQVTRLQGNQAGVAGPSACASPRARPEKDFYLGGGLAGLLPTYLGGAQGGARGSATGVEKVPEQATLLQGNCRGWKPSAWRHLSLQGVRGTSALGARA